MMVKKGSQLDEFRQKGWEYSWTAWEKAVWIKNTVAKLSRRVMFMYLSAFE